MNEDIHVKLVLKIDLFLSKFFLSQVLQISEDTEYYQ